MLLSKTKWKSLGYQLMIVVLMFTYTPLVSALTTDDLNSIIGQTPFYDPTATSCPTGGGAGTPQNGTSSANSTWTSNVQPPYFLESYVINVLEDIATKLNVPESSAVTQEHVVAMVAWAYAEGGNITNTSGIFNVWNTGLSSRPDLLGSAANGSGLQSFKSFDAGVEANAIVMTAPFQNRLGQVLTQSSSTGEQFVQALTNFQSYPGNHPWAEADDPNGGGNQQTYLAGLLNLLQQARKDYPQMASVEIGPGQENTNHVPTSELQFATGGTVTTTGTGTAGSSGSSGGCGASASCSSSTASATTTTGTSSVRSNVVACAQQELALWQSQPNYKSPYPAFTYAQTGFLKYSDGNYEEWCADFASWVYNQAGYPFSGGESGGWRLPGVGSIQSLGQSGKNFHWHPAGGGYTPQPGDLAIYGGHVNIFISSSGGISQYVGGDQGGVNEPSGTYGTKNPPSGSVVSINSYSGFDANGTILGYVSPD